MRSTPSRRRSGSWSAVAGWTRVGPHGNAPAGRGRRQGVRRAHPDLGPPTAGRCASGGPFGLRRGRRLRAAAAPPRRPERRGILDQVATDLWVDELGPALVPERTPGRMRAPCPERPSPVFCSENADAAASGPAFLTGPGRRGLPLRTATCSWVDPQTRATDRVLARRHRPDFCPTPTIVAGGLRTRRGIADDGPGVLSTQPRVVPTV